MVNWQPLLEGSVDGLSLAVGGVCVGDPVRALPYKDITQVIPSTPKVRRKGGLDAASGAGDDEPKGAVTQESPLEEVRNRGGHIHFHGGAVACEVADGLIRKMWIRGPLLSGLPFTAQADIERVLGPARGIERKFGHVLHHYPERSFSVGWHAREDRLDHMILGAVDWVATLFGAKEVLREWIAAAHAGLDPDWKEPTDRATSQWVRYARVMALLRAFELSSPRDFAEGNFLERKPMSAYPIASRVLREVQRMSGLSNPDSDVLGRLFWWLLIYRVQAEKLLQINEGWLVAGHLGIFTALQVTGDANEGVAASLEEIEALLIDMIDPSGKQVTEREMIERWGWPDVDLEQLLMDEL